MDENFILHVDARKHSNRQQSLIETESYKLITKYLINIKRAIFS